MSPKLAYSIEETVASTGIGRSTIFEEIKAGRLKARKRGRSTIILAGDLAEYLEALPVMA
ncbi:MAG: DNA-binding protein [Sphingomonas sp.]|nr:MAG: DNA-binding protein [Sphingomonas sp.]